MHTSNTIRRTHSLPTFVEHGSSNPFVEPIRRTWFVEPIRRTHSSNMVRRTHSSNMVRRTHSSNMVRRTPVSSYMVRRTQFVEHGPPILRRPHLQERNRPKTVKKMSEHHSKQFQIHTSNTVRRTHSSPPFVEQGSSNPIRRIHSSNMVRRTIFVEPYSSNIVRRTQFVEHGWSHMIFTQILGG